MGKTNGYWAKHPKPELQAVLMEFHQQGWTIIDPGKYYKVRCACTGLHKTTVHISPSDPNYPLNKRKWLQRQPCYRDNDGN